TTKSVEDAEILADQGAEDDDAGPYDRGLGEDARNRRVRRHGCKIDVRDCCRGDVDVLRSARIGFEVDIVASLRWSRAFEFRCNEAVALAIIAADRASAGRRVEAENLALHRDIPCSQYPETIAKTGLSGKQACFSVIDLAFSRACKMPVRPRLR